MFILFISPPYWNCATGEDYLLLVKNNNSNLILSWIQDNIKMNKNLKNINYQFGLLNRLDFETSGIIMISKNIKSWNKYRKNINDHIKTNKIYITLVEGIVEHEFGIIELPLYFNKLKRTTTVNNINGKFSYTEYIKLQELKDNNKFYSLLLVKIKTGRTHQIRVHLKSIGHLVVCDKKYETDKKKLFEECQLTKRLFLHVIYYKIENDVDSYVKIPKDLDNALNKLQIKKINMKYNNAFDLLKSNVFTNIFLN